VFMVFVDETGNGCTVKTWIFAIYYIY
jgi:hypothetical protein